MIQGKQIYLRAVTSEDWPALLEWRNDPKLRRWFRGRREITQGEQIAYWRSRDGKTDEVHFSIIATEKTTHACSEAIIGYCGFSKIHECNRTAELNAFIDPKLQKNGYGKDAILTLLQYGFEEIGLNRIFTEVFAGNDALKILQHLNFQIEGKYREHHYTGGEFLDCYLVGMLRREWDEVRSRFRR